MSDDRKTAMHLSDPRNLLKCVALSCERVVKIVHTSGCCHALLWFVTSSLSASPIGIQENSFLSRDLYPKFRPTLPGLEAFFFCFEVDKFPTLPVHDGIRSSCKLLPAIERRFLFLWIRNRFFVFLITRKWRLCLLQEQLCLFLRSGWSAVGFSLSFAPVRLCWFFSLICHLFSASHPSLTVSVRSVALRKMALQIHSLHSSRLFFFEKLNGESRKSKINQEHGQTDGWKWQKKNWGDKDLTGLTSLVPAKSLRLRNSHKFDRE